MVPVAANGSYLLLNKTVLYGFAEDTVLQAIGLTAADAHKSENGTRYYTADKLNKAMNAAMYSANTTGV